MFDVAVRNVLARWSGFVGAFVALLCSAALVSACGFMVQSGLASGIAPQRYAGVPVVVAAYQELPVAESTDVPFGDHVPLPDSLRAGRQPHRAERCGTPAVADCGAVQRGAVRGHEPARR